MKTGENIRDLSIIHLHILVELIKNGNACSAAKRLNVSQPTISYHLGKMRKIFFDDLFIKTNNGLKPTERCRKLGTIAADLISRIEEDMAHAGDFIPEEIDRELSIVADNTVSRWFGPLLLEVLDRTPRIKLCARGWSFSSFDDIAAGRVQFGIHVMKSDNKGIYQVELAPCYRVFVVRKNHPLADKGFVEKSDLAEFPIVLHDLSGMNSHGNSLLERTLSQMNAKANILAKLGDCRGIWDILKHTNAITYTPPHSLPEDLSELQLLRPASCFEDVKGCYYLSVCRANYGSQETDWLISFLSQSFSRFTEQCYGREELENLLY